MKENSLFKNKKNSYSNELIVMINVMGIFYNKINNSEWANNH